MWREPKTDWRSEDKFNIEDYNRIKGNLSSLRESAVSLYPPFSMEDMGEDKTYRDFWYADEFNLFERNLETLRRHSYPADIGEEKTFRDNTSFIDWTELNRIEKACLFYHRLFTSQTEMKRRLALRLGAGKEVKVS